MSVRSRVGRLRISQKILQKELQEEFKAESSKEFIVGIGKLDNMYCSSHNNKRLSLYCPECSKTMCCTCAEVVSKHAGQHCNIQEEIQRRKDELQALSPELNKKSIYQDTCEILQELMKDKVRKKNETRELIQQALNELMQEKEKQFLGALEEQHNQDVQVLSEKIRDIQKMVEKMESTKRMVEKMQLSASNQDAHPQHVMDTLFCIRESLENIKKMQPPVVDVQMQSENFTEVITQLQMFIERVIGEKESASAIFERASNKNCSVKSPAKRKNVQQAVHTPPKVVRNGPNDCEQRTSTRQDSWLEDQPEASSASAGVSHAAGNDAGEASDASSWLSSLIFESADPDDPSCLEPEDESSDEEFLDDTLPQSSQREATIYSIDSPTVPIPESGTLVFFDLKILSGKNLQLVAVGDNSNCFSVNFINQLVSDRGDVKKSLCEQGLENFLGYLQSLRMPILVGYNLWSMNIPALVTALKAINKEECFVASIFGFLDAFPFIKEKTPNAPNYTLKNLSRLYCEVQLNDANAEHCAKTLKNLCTFLDINPMMKRHPVVLYPSLQCYISLQPLLQGKLLSKPSAQTLALHNIDLSRLKSVFEDNPINGLQRFAQEINRNLRNNKRKIRHLSKIRSYFQTCTLVTQLYMSAATN